jgi:predicted secreted protein
MSNAIAGVGTKFYRWGGSAWAAIAEINSITGPSMTRDFIDVTSLDSTGGFREFITGFRDAGTVSLAMNFTHATFTIMKEDFENDTPQSYMICLPDEEVTSLEFLGLVTEIPLTIPTDDKITADVTIKISGTVDLTSGTGSQG